MTWSKKFNSVAFQYLSLRQIRLETMYFGLLAVYTSNIRASSGKQVIKMPMLCLRSSVQRSERHGNARQEEIVRCLHPLHVKSNVIFSEACFPRRMFHLGEEL